MTSLLCGEFENASRTTRFVDVCVKEKVSLTVCCVVTQDNKKEDKILREEMQIAVKHTLQFSGCTVEVGGGLYFKVFRATVSPTTVQFYFTIFKREWKSREHTE